MQVVAREIEQIRAQLGDHVDDLLAQRCGLGLAAFLLCHGQCSPAASAHCDLGLGNPRHFVVRATPWTQHPAATA